jgi:nicotinamide mononucleotide transporter
MEFIAVLFSLISVYLTRKQNIWCWLFGLIGTICYFFIFKEDNAWANMTLQLIFLVQGVYGWYNWRNVDNREITRSDNMMLSIQLSLIMFGIAFLYALNGLYDLNLTLLDITTTIISVCALYLTANKKLESWGYWGVANIFYLLLFIQNGHWLSTGLYTIFLINAYFGYKEWKNNINQHTF